MSPEDLIVDRVKPATLPTPLRFGGSDPDHPIRYHTDADRVAVTATFSAGSGPGPLGFERAGPRELIAWDPAACRAAVVTCGGICPGLNDVIRGLVMCLRYNYGLQDIVGVRFGYQGLAADAPAPIALTHEVVDDIHRDGGTILGSSRGTPPTTEIVDTLARWGINLFFVIGGDGTQRGSHAIAAESRRRGMDLAVVGIPKTIDNDIAWVDQTFGFDTAVEIAGKVIDCAHIEAKAAHRGLGLVKLMGRDSGFIAAQGALASLEANVVLIPEVPFELDGEQGLLNFLEKRLARKDHAVVVVAEGAGQDLFVDTEELFDRSGNRLQLDIGLLLKERIVAHFAGQGQPVSMKYFDPSYLVRSAPANSVDSILCDRLAHEAVHAAMNGKTDMMVGRWYGKFIYLPLPLVVSGRKRIKPNSTLWRSVLEATGQPSLTNTRTMFYQTDSIPKPA
jgi:6-phosphofructokinase 1